MRDFATNEELKVVNALQITMNNLQTQQYTPEETLAYLSVEAEKYLAFYCKNDQQQYTLEKAREKRGW
jgi:hypothetical protein